MVRDEDIDKIDEIGFDKINDKLILEIYDYLNWDNEYEHYDLLEAKINTCLKFIESEEIVGAYPSFEKKNFIIRIILFEKPTIKALKFVSNSVTALKDVGYFLDYNIVK